MSFSPDYIYNYVPPQLSFVTFLYQILQTRCQATPTIRHFCYSAQICIANKIFRKQT